MRAVRMRGFTEDRRGIGRRRRRTLVRAAAIALATAPSVVVLTVAGPAGTNDAHAYWSAWVGGLYSTTPTLDRAAYIYPPPLAQALWLVTALPWQAFFVLWMAASAASLWWLVRPLSFGVRLPVFAIFLVCGGNATVFVALALGSRRAWAWALPLLTKITPAVGLLWYAVRREWSMLGVALGTAVTAAALSFAISPDLWARWASAILADTSHRSGIVVFFLPQVPLPVRVGLAGLLVAWGARSDRSWTIAVGAMLASPDILLSSVPLLAAVPRLSQEASGRPEPSGVDASVPVASPTELIGGDRRLPGSTGPVQ
jgi:hypothetical protein